MPSSPVSAAAVALATAAAGFASLAEAHICVFHPTQRGDAVATDLGPGDPLCYRRTPYCGGVDVPTSPPSVNSFLAGADAQVLFQQNLNHYWESNPGSLDVALSYDLNPTDASWQTLLTIDDFATNDMVTQTNFSATVRMPSKAADHALLRFRYVSHNTAEIDPANNTESIFYNCADIRLVANPGAEADTTTEKAAAAAATTTTAQSQRGVPQTPVATEAGCSTPDEWQAWAVETTLRGSIAHNIVYDGTHQLVQWSRYGPLHVAGVDESLTTLAYYNETIPGQPNYTKPEYLVAETPSAGRTCTLYGADPMYKWSYGPDRSQTFIRKFVENGDNFQEWASTDLQHRFIVKEVTHKGNTACLPVLERHPETTLVFTEVRVGPDAIPQHAFELPSFCKKPVIGHGIV